ncbi:protein prenylyltransferase, partial [Caulochytrium protostelioides]
DPVWADVVPVPLNQSAETQLVPIAYAPEYAEAMGYLRAVMAADECSPRALDLTERIIRSNPAHYTVWHYRADPLTETALMDYERELLNELALDHPKSYQIWHHRQTVIQLTNDPVGELTFIMQALEDDSKNYHAWGYRQWLVQQFALWDREIADTDALLVSDVRNNAAWNERFFYWVQGPR